LVRDVEIGRDGLGVRVDHDRLEAQLAEREPGADAAVVELDALADAIRPAPQDDDALLTAGLGLVFGVVRRIQVRCGRWELAGAGEFPRSEEHTSELQSRGHLVCRLLLEKKKKEKRYD